MFVGKVSCDFIDVIFLIDLLHGTVQIGMSDLSRRHPSTVIGIDTIINACNDRDGILFLKFSVRG